MRARIVYATDGSATYFIDDKPVTEEEFRAAVPSRMDEVLNSHEAPAAPGTGWPMKSKALGVSRRQVEKANEYSKKHGLPVEYEPETGKAIIQSANDRRKVLSHYGMFDRDGFC